MARCDHGFCDGKCHKKVEEPKRVYSPDMPMAAVSYCENASGRLLCVWNRRYGGWTFPGGKVEPGEAPEAAQKRELLEETGLRAVGEIPLIWEAMTDVVAQEEGRGRLVLVYKVTDWEGWPAQMEPSSPVTWFTRDEFLKWTCFKEFYGKMFAAMPRP